MNPVNRLETYLRGRVHGLEERGVPEARLNVEYLMARRLGIPRLELLLHRQDVLAEADSAALDGEIERLASGEPLQYILGDVAFHEITIQTDRRALIPRPETEMLVEWVLACPEIWSEREPRLVDAGTGTGCIALALAAARPAARVLAVDLDPEALSLARENRDRLGLKGRVELRLGDWLSGLPTGSFDAVVSNPPYIPAADCETLERHVREHEPRRALDGGLDGLAMIRCLAPQALACLKPGRPLWLEIGFNQGPVVAARLAEIGFERIEVRHDAAGHDRVVSAWRKP